MGTDSNAPRLPTTVTSAEGGSGQQAFPYVTAHAFRAALKARFTALAQTGGGFGFNELARQFAYDRALARVFTAPDADRWVLKGGGALLTRLEGGARHSKDLDLYFTDQGAAADQAVRALRVALARDHFQFTVTAVDELQEAAKGSRAHVDATLGATRYARFHVDVVVGTAMTAPPDLVRPLTPLTLAGLVRPDYRAFPVPDHLADKLLAVHETHRAGGQAHISSRIKDLVDIALIAATQEVKGSALRTAVVVGALHRNQDLPTQFVVPDVWRAGYPKKAAETARLAPDFDQAVDLARRLFDPVLQGPVDGQWDPVAARWISLDRVLKS